LAKRTGGYSSDILHAYTFSDNVAERRAELTMLPGWAHHQPRGV
jgi:hypothetical protein